MNRLAAVLVALVVLVAVAYGLAFNQVGEWQQAIVLQFGRPVRVVTDPGLYMKTPLVQNVFYFENRLLEYAERLGNRSVPA